MGVYIKGIDMPKEPWDCPCHNGETGQCKVINIGCYDYIPKNCPLVYVPTPHGRLVDIDAEVEKHDCVPILGEHLRLMAKHMTTVIESEE